MKDIVEAIERKLAADARPYLQRSALEGELWWCAPRKHPVFRIMEFADLGFIETTTTDFELTPAPLMEGKAWVKVRLATAGDGASLLKVRPRSALVLRLGLPRDVVLLMPGTTEIDKDSVRDLPTLRLEPESRDPKASADPNLPDLPDKPIDYESWSVCIVPDRPPQALLNPLAWTVNDYALRNPSPKDAGGGPLERSRRLIAEVLGLRDPDLGSSETNLARIRRRAVRVRGEIVRVTITTNRAGRISSVRYAIVVSDNALNGLNRNVCVLAPLVPRRATDDADNGFVPLDDIRVTQRCGPSSVDIWGLRGFSRAISTTHPLSPPLQLRREAPGLWKRLESALQSTYAETDHG